VEIRERRELKFFDDFNINRLLRFDNYIQSNAWLARRHVLTEDVLDDPELEVAEDMYFYLLLASRHQFLFSDTVSAVWNWRSMADDNSMTSVSQYRWAVNGGRLLRRLAQVSFGGGFQGRDVLGRGMLMTEPGAAAVGAPPKQSAGEQEGADAAGTLRGARNDSDDGYKIDFSATKLPYFIVDAHGLSEPETWGRWTVGPKLLLRFRRPLPRSFTLQIDGHAFDSNHEKPISVLVGRTEASLVMSATHKSARYSVHIDNKEGADFILFRIPNPEAPAKLWPDQSDDTRKLGVALIRFDLIESDANGIDH
jgi:hypothetical protein